MPDDNKIENKPTNLEEKKHRLEIWKTCLSVLTPIFILGVGFVINNGFESQKQDLQEAQLKEQKIDLIQKIVPEIIDKGESRNSIMMRLLEKLDTAIAKDIKRELIKNIKASTQNNDTVKTDNILQTAKSIGGALGDTVKTIAAKDFEQKAYESLLKKDVKGAINNFAKADIAYPTYNQASELTELLTANKTHLTDTTSKHWGTIYSKILDDYSWKMPKDVKQKLISYQKK
jgi:hypothetical protein